jgi:hypothetical protein
MTIGIRQSRLGGHRGRVAFSFDVPTRFVIISNGNRDMSAFPGNAL